MPIELENEENAPPQPDEEEGEQRLPLIRSPQFHKHYVTNIVGGLTNYDIRFELLNEKVKDEDGWHGISDALIILTPVAAKRLFKMLEEILDLYEAENGDIDIDSSEDRVY